jgi:hypothetical protein
MSAGFSIFTGELNKFQTGRSRIDLLRELHWRGGLEMAAEYNGKSVFLIDYYVLPNDGREDTAQPILAVFVDDKFVKFIKAPPQETIEVPYEDTTVRYLKPIKVGDLSWLAAALECQPVDIEAFQRAVNTPPPARPPHDPDWGLTIVALALMPFMHDYASPADHKRNAVLRDQFNPARLSIGMTQAQVQSVFHAKPLESGTLEAGSYEIYGSNEFFDFAYSADIILHFENVLIVFREGKTILMRAVPAGDGWRQKMHYTDLPKPPAPMDEHNK